MKKLLVFISILIVAISLKSCSSSDSDEIQYEGDIIGKWRLSQLFINNEDLQISECEKKMTIEVFENGTYIENDYLYNDTDNAGLDAWIQNAVDGKINNCWKRMQSEWTTKLMNDDSFTDSIPSNQADFVALVIARSDYKNRKARDDAQAL